MAATTSDLAAALRYGPQAAAPLRRSQYLTDALRAMSESGQNIQSSGELGAKLLALAITNRGLRKAEDRATKAIAADRDAETASLLGGLRGPTFLQLPSTPTTPPATPAPPTQTAPMEPPTQAVPPPPAPVQSAPLTTPAISPEDRLNVARMVWGEARGEPAEGQRAAAAVALNRARERGQPVGQVVAQPHQFNGYNPRSQALGEADLGAVLQNIDPLLQGKIPDPTGGADHFYNPALANPAWGRGQAGQNIGQHRFLNLEGGRGPAPAPEMAAAPQGAPPAPPAPQPQFIGQPGPIADQPFQIAQTFPSAPGSSPSVAGTPPAAPVPQAAVGGNQVPMGPQAMGVTDEQIALVEQMLRNPRTHDAGVAYAYELRKAAAKGREFQTSTVNGVPVWMDPTRPGMMVSGAVPGQLQNRTMRAEDLGIPAPPGTILSVSPTGKVEIVTRPESGQMVVGGPGASYREAPVQGGKQDPTSPANLVSNEGKLRDDYDKRVAPYIAAREGYQKVIQAAGDMTPAGSIALVFGYMKTLDPGSTVREGEQATVANSGTIPESITNMYNRLLGGQGTLTPLQRAQFANSAKGQFEVYQRSFDADSKRYSDLATSYGFDPTRVVRTFDPIQGLKPQATNPGAAPGGSRPPVPQAAYSAHQRLRIDPNAPLGSQNNPFVARDDETARRLDTPANRGKHIVMPNGDIGVIE